MAKTMQSKYKCFCCGKEYVESNYYKSNSEFYINMGKIPYCKQCVGKLYQHFLDRYANEGCLNPEKKAVRRLCMAFDIYFNEKAYNDAINDAKRRKMDITALSAYMKIVQLKQGRDNTYDDTVYEEEQANIESAFADIALEKESEIDESTIKFFGAGFAPEDYEFLQEQYDDWTARHECNTKAQEEVFKRICFKQLEILKATRRNEDTKNLDDTFQKLLDTAKLQPKQNSGEAMSDAQTFGTLIDKWENTRPIPEVKEELKDVDKIGLLTHVFYTGHMAKVLDLPSSLTKIYDEYIQKYTVEKQEHSGEVNNEVLFNSIFGKKDLED